MKTTRAMMRRRPNVESLEQRALLTQLPQYARKSSNLEVFFRCKSLFDGLTKVSTAM